MNIKESKYWRSHMSEKDWSDVELTDPPKLNGNTENVEEAIKNMMQYMNWQTNALWIFMKRSIGGCKRYPEIKGDVTKLQSSYEILTKKHHELFEKVNDLEHHKTRLNGMSETHRSWTDRFVAPVVTALIMLIGMTIIEYLKGGG